MRAILSKIRGRSPGLARVAESLAETYVRSGRLPWSAGYSKYKDAFIRGVLRDDAMMSRFRAGEKLPEAYAPRLDERVIEYPWVLARLRTEGWIMDAGSTFNAPLILDLPQIEDRHLLIYTLGTDYITLRPTVSYLFGDLRETVLKDAIFESIVCISTLEHIGYGLDFRQWSQARRYPDADPDSFKQALAEFSRLLKPGGQLLLTVPYGRREDHGWLQQFDRDGVAAIKSAFGGRTAGEAYYKYGAEGWQIAAAEACAEARYFNIHEGRGFDADFAAAARAVTCLELVKA
jgi:hypothetical protein